jgi:hypothetical protein
MAFLVFPIITVLFFLGVGAQAWQLAQTVPGAGVSGHMDTVAAVSAQQAQAFGAACVATASATPGLVSLNITPALPAGVSMPTGAVCMAAARTGGGRDIYGYVPVAPGAAGLLIQNTQGNAAWFRVKSQGAAVNLVTGVTYAIPAMIPVGALIDWVQTTT